MGDRRLVDTVVNVCAIALLAFVLLTIWMAAAGHLPSQEPSPTTWYSGPGDLTVVTP